MSVIERCHRCGDEGEKGRTVARGIVWCDDCWSEANDDFDPSEAQLRTYYNVGGSDDPQYGPRARND